MATASRATGTDAAGRRARHARNLILTIVGTALLAAAWFSLPGTPGPPPELRWPVRLTLITSAAVGLLSTLFGLSLPAALRHVEGRLRAWFAGGNVEARFWSLVAAFVAVLVLLTTAVALAALPPPMRPQPALVGTFALQESADPTALAAGPNGEMWFTEFEGRRVGRVSRTGQVQEFPIPADPVREDQPLVSGITAGPEGNMWVTATNNVFRVSATGDFRRYPMPDLSGGNITTGPDKALWLTTGAVGVGPDIVRLDPVTGESREYLVPDPPGQEPDEVHSSDASDITVGPDGNLWFTLVREPRVGRITPQGEITVFPVPGKGSVLFSRITTGSDGNLWRTSDDGLVRITPEGDARLFPLFPFSGVQDILTGPDGFLWFTELVSRAGTQVSGYERLGRFDPRHIDQFPYYEPLQPDSGVGALAAGPGGTLWRTESDRHRLVAIRSSTPAQDPAVTAGQRDRVQLEVTALRENNTAVQQREAPGDSPTDAQLQAVLAQTNPARERYAEGLAEEIESGFFPPSIRDEARNYLAAYRSCLAELQKMVTAQPDELHGYVDEPGLLDQAGAALEQQTVAFNQFRTVLGLPRLTDEAKTWPP